MECLFQHRCDLVIMDEYILTIVRSLPFCPRVKNADTYHRRTGVQSRALKNLYVSAKTRQGRTKRTHFTSLGQGHHRPNSRGHSTTRHSMCTDWRGEFTEKHVSCFFFQDQGRKLMYQRLQTLEPDRFWKLDDKKKKKL